MKYCFYLILLLSQLLPAQQRAAEAQTVEAIVQVNELADQEKVREIASLQCVVVHRFDLLLITGGDEEIRHRLAGTQRIDHSQQLPFVNKLFFVSQIVMTNQYLREGNGLKPGDIIKARFRVFRDEDVTGAVVGFPRRRLDETFRLLDYQFLRHADIETTRFGRVRGGSLAIVSGVEPGWLFRGRERYLWQYENRNLFSAKELHEYEARAKELHDWLSERGIEFYIVIIPSKFTIYPENFPRKILKHAAEQTRLEQADAIMSRAMPRRWLNLTGPISAEKEKSKELLYYPLDHHWNYRGAYIGYRETINMFARQFPELSPLSWIELHTVDSEASEMSLAGMSNIETLVNETDVGVKPRAAAEASQTSRRIALLGDSYGWYLQPFFSYNFDHVFYHYANEAFTIDEAFIQREKPDIVVIVLFESILERVMLYSLP